MTILLGIFLLLAVASVYANAVWSSLADKRNQPLLKWFFFWADDESPWWKRLLSAIIALVSGLGVQGFLLFPIITVAIWAESWQSEKPPFDMHLREKGAALAACWMLIVGQLMYRIGYEAGRRKPSDKQ